MRTMRRQPLWVGYTEPWFLRDRVWGRNNRICRAYCDRDRRKRVADFLYAEVPPLPDPVLVTEDLITIP